MDARTNDQEGLVVTIGEQYDVRKKTDSAFAPKRLVVVAGAVHNLGKPNTLSAYYAGVDELVLLNVTSFQCTHSDT